MLGAVSAPTSIVYLAMSKPLVMAYWGIPACILDVALAIILIPRYGAVGAAIASTTSQVFNVGGGVAYASLKYDFKIPFRQLALTSIAAMVCGGCAYIIVIVMTGIMGLLVAIILGSISFISTIRLVGALTEQDMQSVHVFLGSHTSRRRPAWVNRALLRFLLFATR